MADKNPGGGLDQQIEELAKVAAKTTDPCITAVYIALTDEDVKKKLKDRIDNGDIEWKGFSCLDTTGTSEKQDVLFRFEYRDGVFYFFEPSFLVEVNLRYGCIGCIQDPYIPRNIPQNGSASNNNHSDDTSQSDDGQNYVIYCDPCVPSFWGLWWEVRRAFWRAICEPEPYPCRPVLLEKAHTRGGRPLMR